jgi:organic radical activating enzyme
MTYAVKEIFPTLQGEGAQTGRAAVFLRFAGCNLWSGREEDRASAICRFCDTDFKDVNGPGGGKFSSAEALAGAVAQAWQADEAAARKFVVCTGGEPLLQLDGPLINSLHSRGFEIAVRPMEPLPPQRASIGSA